ncbi:MAG: helix-turn-helix transcriptional regulator [Bacteroidia bacterium]
MSASQLIRDFKVSGVYQSQKFGELAGDLVSNFNERKFRLLKKDIQKLVNNDIRIRIRWFIYERFAYQEMNLPDSLNTPDQYLKMIKQAAPLADDQLLSELYTKYAALCDPSKKLYYLLKAIEIRERIGVRYFTDISSNYYWASNLLYSITDYTNSAKYAERGVALYKNHDIQNIFFLYILAVDLTGASYLKINKPDSAIRYYTKLGTLINNRIKNYTNSPPYPTLETLKIWQGVVNGALGKANVLQKKYKIAYSLLMKGLQSSTQFKQWNDVSGVQNSLAKIDMLRGHTSLALSRYLQAYRLASKSNSLHELATAAEGASDAFAANYQYDSAYIYHKKYLHWKELQDKKLNQNRLDNIKAQVDFEHMQKVLLQSQTNLINQKRIRNSVLAAIVFLTTIALLLYNRKRLQMSLQNEKIERARQKSEAERVYAQKQINQFVHNIAEKNNLINQLQNQISATNNAEINNALNHFVILNEEDWQQFKINFETANPDFIRRLKKKMPQITQGEQRIMLLAKLGFNTKEMANATGVSPETIRSVSSRMRKKFNLPTNLQTIANEI